MIISSPRKLLEKILYVSRFKSLYILGAGASYKYIPISYGLLHDAKELLLDSIQGISVSPPRLLSEMEEARFEISGHVLHKDYRGNILIDETDRDIHDIFIRQNPEILELCGLLNYSLNKLPEKCPEYQFFNKVNLHSVFLNLNHDSLCENFVKNRKIITLHGTVSSELKNLIQNNIFCILDDAFGHSAIRYIIPKNLHVATKESEHILSQRNEYRELKNELVKNKFPYIVIIGYSFFKKNGSEIHDTYTYDLIRSYLIEHKECEVIIIDPEPNFVADMLSKTLSVSKISLYQMKWDCFVNAFFDVVKNKNLPYFKFSEFELRLFNLLYNHYKYLG